MRPPLSYSPVAADEFAACMAGLGPFEPQPRLAAGVSGGADSMALALLAADWAGARGGALIGFVVDHGLRPASAAEADLTVRRLADHRIPARLLRLNGLSLGPALAERARAARYAMLRDACAEAGILHLMIGHHAADQAETVVMRRQSGSGQAGLAGMPAVSEQRTVRLLRPLLSFSPARLRATLRNAGLDWVEDPSNGDQRALRARLRAGLDDPDGSGPAIAALCGAARKDGVARAVAEDRVAATLAARVVFHPEGFGIMAPGPIDADALRALIQTIAGAAFPPPARAVAALAAHPRPATLAGVRLLPAGSLGAGLLLVREVASLQPPISARAGALWDGRFLVQSGAFSPQGATIGALGAEARLLRRWSPLPSAVLQTLPAVRVGNSLVTVPHLHYPDRATCHAVPVVFSPLRAAAGAPFLPVPEPGGNLC